MRTLGAVGAIADLAAESGLGVRASPQVEEQKPIADPTAESFNDTVWTSSPFYHHAISLMRESPLIDTHIDLPQVIRSLGQPASPL